MGESKVPFETVRVGCVRFVPSLELLLARWAEGCDEDPHSSAMHVLKESGFSFVSLAGENAGTYAEGFECPHCGSELAVERGEAPTPSCFLTGGQYRPGGQSNPRSLQCRACGVVTRPSALVEHLHVSKPKRRKFLETYCGGARPQELRWVAVRLDGKVLVSPEVEAAVDELAQNTYPPEVELCLILAIEAPLGVAELELPYVTVPLSDRGEVTLLSWHGEPPTGNERGRYDDWTRRTRQERAAEIEQRVAAFRVELECGRTL